MYETKDVEIAGVTYRLTKFGASQCVRIALRVAKYIGHFMSANEKQPGASNAALMASVLDKISEEDFFFVSNAFAERTTVHQEGKVQILSKIFDSHFSGKGQELLTWFAECMVFQLVDFFGGAFNAPAASESPEESDSSSPKESTG